MNKTELVGQVAALLNLEIVRPEKEEILKLVKKSTFLQLEYQPSRPEKR